jgi:hypothetical protein
MVWDSSRSYLNLMVRYLLKQVTRWGWNNADFNWNRCYQIT